MIHLFWELLRVMRRRGFGRFLSAWLILILFLGLLDMAILAWSSLGPGVGGELFALLEPDLLPGEINRLYLEIRGWKEAAQVEFLFAEEVQAGLIQLPIPAKAKGPPRDLFRIRLREPEDLPTVGERLEEFQGVAAVLSPGRSSLNRLLLSFDRLRAGLIALLVVLGLLAVVRLRAALRSLIMTFSGEIRLLSLSGVPQGMMERPFLLLGGLLGLGGGLLLMIGLYLAHHWGLAGTAGLSLYNSFPALLEPGIILSLALLSLGLGLTVGLLSAAWSLLTLRRIAL
ncbi:TPA: hypothetical protein EYP12_04730 [Candidatus Bipolaricaulota bacterium]|nr:hypothetical protein [Candidatus Bipolaricaulota bacterium]